jgi:hypothetical protein
MEGEMNNAKHKELRHVQIWRGLSPGGFGGSFCRGLSPVDGGLSLVDCAKGTLRGGYRVPTEVHGG